MSEIICPHCNKAFTIDENDYAKLISQVRTAEFDKEIHEKLQAEADKQKASYDLEKKETEIQHKADISEKEKQIEKLQALIDAKNTEKELAITQALSEKEAEINELRSQLKTAESEKAAAVSQAVKVKDDELTKGSHFWVDDKLYFSRGINDYLPEGIKDISKVEIAAVGDGEYLRYSGDPKFIEDGTLIELPCNAYSEIMEYCEKKEKKCIIFYIENGHALFLDGNLELKAEFDV